MQSRTQSNACARARMALALGKLNFSCAVIGLTFINRACRQRTGTPKFRGSGCQFPQSQCHPSPHTGIALGTRLVTMMHCKASCHILYYPASKVLSYFFSAQHGEARETLQNLCINSFEHARRLLSNCLFPRRRFNK